MITKITHSKIFNRWLDIQNTNALQCCFGRTPSKILQLLDNFALEKLPENGHILLEFPLLGDNKCDLSFSYEGDTFLSAQFKNSTGKKIEPLMWHLSHFIPQNGLLGIEVDIDEKNNNIPAVFFECSYNTKHVLDSIWAENAQPVHWKKLTQLVDILPKEWRILYIGMMQGRENAPIKLIFSHTDDYQYLTDDIQSIQNLLSSIGFRPLANDTIQKLLTLRETKFIEWNISVDLYPNLQFGDNIGIEVILIRDDINPMDTFLCDDGKKLTNLLQQWNLADERIFLLQNLINKHSFQFLGEKTKALTYVFPNHIKIQLNNNQPIKAKTYLSHAYHLYE